MVISCPECGAQLRLRSAPGPGQKVRCPKCSATFTPGREERVTEAPRKPAPAKKPVRRAEPEEDLDEDDFDEDDNDRNDNNRNGNFVG